jgi:hypothetical protein
VTNSSNIGILLAATRTASHAHRCWKQPTICAERTGRRQPTARPQYGHSTYLITQHTKLDIDALRRIALPWMGTGRDHARDIFCRQARWQGREPPMGEARQRLVGVDPAQPVEAEKPQESPDRGDQVLGRARTRPLGPIEHECPDAPRVPLTEILAQSVQQVSGTATVMPEGWGRSPSVSLKPFAKRDDQGWLTVRPREHRLGLAHPRSAGMKVKTLGPKNSGPFGVFEEAP